MKRKDYFVVIIVVVGIALALIYESGILGPNASRPTAFEFNNKTYSITAYASNTTEREKGLMNATVTNSTFMLFYFGQPGIYSFWMKDTYSQLDIIWLNYSGSTGMAKVVYVVDAPPCVNYSSDQSGCRIYTPSSEANYVLEAKAGFAERNNMTVGSSIKFLH